MRSETIWLIRVGVFGTALLFSIIVLGLSANYISKFHSVSIPGFGTIHVSSPSWANLALATSILTLISVGPMLVIDIIRKGALTSWIMVEAIVVGFLSILWLATGADAADYTNGVVPDCSDFVSFGSSLNGIDGLSGVNDLLNEAQTLCRSYQAIEAFAFLNWLLLMGYIIAIIVLAFISANRGNGSVWQSSVRETDFFAGKSGGMGTNMPMTQQPYHPQGTPSTMQPQGYPQQQGYGANV